MRRLDSRFVQAALVVLLISIGVAATAPTAAPASPDTPADTDADAAVRRLAFEFVDAFNRGDAKALAAFWAPDADYIDVDGREIRGRDAILAEYTRLFADNKGLSLRLEVHALKFPAAGIALEDGVSSVIGPEGTLPSRSRYSNVFVKRDGTWMLSSVRESPYIPPNQSEHLDDLAWMVGEWVEDRSDPGPRAHAVFVWSQDRNFILGDRGIVVGDALTHMGTERIGWDPAAKRVRSWSFESDGGFGEGAWTPDGRSWKIRTTSTLVSGSQLQMTALIQRVDAGTITWQATNQTVDGNPLPDSPVVTMKRVP